ncbi:hypothetical protein BN1049_01685 [Pseudomonas saudimassiliensis]|uniref:Uncharacterized protein n=1 Tax=Pseudomonas saudimassiliensis TaxID=1461581 RepID=A0A078MEN1_9PSED|nr:hypothetical protein BN1049_01685 [Pseudomonas saudimassiliensis]CEF26752.1 hypothetical protein BN1049_01685 [Pseudomonas saudimassiliensis]
MQRGIVKLAQALAGEDDNIQMIQISTVVSEGFTGDTLDLVPINCPADIFLGNDQPQSRMFLAVMPGQQQDIGA